MLMMQNVWRVTSSLPRHVRVASFVDLDGTFFQSKSRMNDDTDIRAVAFGDNGWIGYMSAFQSEIAEFLFRRGMVIPTTGRTREELAHVHLPFTGYKILSHGALVLDANNQLDAEWVALQQEAYYTNTKVLPDIAEQIRTVALHHDISARVEVKYDGEDKFQELYIKAVTETDFVSTLLALVIGREVALPSGFSIHHNMREVSVHAEALSKRRAVLFVMERIREESPHVVMLGFGDSISDAAFMGMCDHSFYPSGSQLDRYFNGGKPA